MQPNHTYSQYLEDRFRMFLVLQNFYAGRSLKWSVQDWKEICSSIEAYQLVSPCQKIANSIDLLQGIQEEEVLSLEYDFNRLFVGPDKLLASPYESSYRNPEKTLMQRETLQVREFYSWVGLEVANKGIEPDDHLALELEFICYLLATHAEEGFPVEYQEFLEKHLLVWYKQHCECIHNHSENPICQAMAYLLEGVLEQEQERLLPMRKKGNEADE
ncbi:TorD/DmsD family molecular chaperone [Brevibacillus ginsengisoli]|uniref:TorD/DmsD family molecular chaperone n=1 Tax=Brevibacillus ginsengisoli TaxID=363854 RepID=UPI003CF5B40B